MTALTVLHGAADAERTERLADLLEQTSPTARHASKPLPGPRWTRSRRCCPTDVYPRARRSRS
ncbi:hypothetical protein KV557_40455 [Kitasatospora aureofaciens]|uniref:hypothetical protein n=1 Tax=Kitasatospora aureofaciens TaxID=1894 RepID=UPI001C468875|nr:hypothetical protein [Kitasatospora aureofaciens]MBV6703288.1 hypothetical protein [Kitasatospora aureofaciens]